MEDISYEEELREMGLLSEYRKLWWETKKGLQNH